MKEAGGEITHEIMTGGVEIAGGGGREWWTPQSASHWRRERLYVSHTRGTRVNKWHQLIRSLLRRDVTCSCYFGVMCCWMMLTRAEKCCA